MLLSYARRLDFVLAIECSNGSARSWSSPSSACNECSYQNDSMLTPVKFLSRIPHIKQTPGPGINSQYFSGAWGGPPLELWPPSSAKAAQPGPGCTPALERNWWPGIIRMRGILQLNVVYWNQGPWHNSSNVLSIQYRMIATEFLQSISDEDPSTG